MSLSTSGALPKRKNKPTTVNIHHMNPGGRDYSTNNSMMKTSDAAGQSLSLLYDTRTWFRKMVAYVMVRSSSLGHEIHTYVCLIDGRLHEVKRSPCSLLTVRCVFLSNCGFTASASLERWICKFLDWSMSRSAFVWRAAPPANRWLISGHENRGCPANFLGEVRYLRRNRLWVNACTWCGVSQESLLKNFWKWTSEQTRTDRCSLLCPEVCS